MRLPIHREGWPFIAIAVAANAALLRFLADMLDVPRSWLSITSGASSRRKRVVIAGLAPDELEIRLQAALENQS